MGAGVAVGRSYTPWAGISPTSGFLTPQRDLLGQRRRRAKRRHRLSVGRCVGGSTPSRLHEEGTANRRVIPGIGVLRFASSLRALPNPHPKKLRWTVRLRGTSGRSSARIDLGQAGCWVPDAWPREID